MAKTVNALVSQHIIKRPAKICFVEGEKDLQPVCGRSSLHCSLLSTHHFD